MTQLPEGIWGGPVMIEDKADAVMFTIGLLRRLAGQQQPHSREWDYLLDSANTLENLLVGQQSCEGENMKEESPFEKGRKEGRDRADAANAARIAQVGVDLMNSYNRGKKDASEMAAHGHDTATGYEFYIERNGFTFQVAVSRDLE